MTDQKTPLSETWMDDFTVWHSDTHSLYMMEPKALTAEIAALEAKLAEAMAEPDAMNALLVENNYPQGESGVDELFRAIKRNRPVKVSDRLPTKRDGPFVLARIPWENSSQVRNAKRRNPKKMTEPAEYHEWYVVNWRRFHNDVIWFTHWRRIDDTPSEEG